jgi:hypothetical protein
MVILGVTLAGKIAITVFCWLVALGALATAVELTRKQLKRDQRFGETLFVRVISFLPRSAVRGIYGLIGLVFFALPVLGITGVLLWTAASGWPSDVRAGFVQACEEASKGQASRCGCAANRLEKSDPAYRLDNLPPGDPRLTAALRDCGLLPAEQ